VFPIAFLRGRCPCAQCREEREQAAEEQVVMRVLSGIHSTPLAVVDAELVGNYAIPDRLVGWACLGNLLVSIFAGDLAGGARKLFGGGK